MKRGTKKTIKLADLIEVPEDEEQKAEAEARKAELGDRTVTLEFVGKRKAMRWFRQAQALDLEVAKDREKLKDEYGPKAFEDETEDSPAAKARSVLSIEHLEKAVDFSLDVIGEVLEGGRAAAEDLFDEDSELLDPLAEKALEMHRLEARAGLSSGQ